MSSTIADYDVVNESTPTFNRFRRYYKFLQEHSHSLPVERQGRLGAAGSDAGDMDLMSFVIHEIMRLIEYFVLWFHAQSIACGRLILQL